ncbi:hypothetical protein RchiOBHm_Chr4g0399801 [Rosa chinensis]|uniref:Transmembrane protein n=1 Tax=Rosa chinensis TaxID=74649 RepID=A0A2P6QSN1_ROSCH|nr:hypothetical protein RchiOBHm_Chr4g0399801 [Rosa chinensis]
MKAAVPRRWLCGAASGLSEVVGLGRVEWFVEWVEIRGRNGPIRGGSWAWAFANALGLFCIYFFYVFLFCMNCFVIIYFNKLHFII